MHQKEVGLSAARERLFELVDDVQMGEHDVVLIGNGGKAVVALIDAKRYQRMQELEDRFRQLELKAALRGETYALDEVLRELGVTA